MVEIALSEKLQDCRRCELWQHATQAVAGEGIANARIMLIGEQPGNEEDLGGHPFIGPAGRLLDECLHAAKLERDQIFITNAVKHFKWRPRGKRRLHEKPNLMEINACNLWLTREIECVTPQVLVALGATALRALLGRSLAVGSARQMRLQHSLGATIIASYHPSAILRAEGESAATLRESLIEDLERARTL